MKSILNRFNKALWGGNVTLSGKIFNTLAMAGCVISLIMVIASLISDSTVGEVIINFGSAVFSVAMLLVHIKTNNYQLCSVITISVIFLLGFPAIFFSSDGYTGGMPSFFIFAIIFTIFLIRGKTMIVLVALQYVVFISISFYAYYNPESIINYRDDYSLLLDIVIGFVIVSLILGATMYIQFRLFLKQQKQLELARLEAERANKAKSAFLANMNHEIRTPIGIILGTNEIIARDAHSKQIKEQVAKIKSAGELLDSLINNVLDFVKIEAEKTVLSPQPYKLSAFLNEIEQYSKVLCKKKELDFSLFTDVSINDYLVGDTLAIKQILLNIINNAVKYTEKGAVSLVVEQKPSEKEDEIILCFVISDTGIGIRQEEVDEIFDSFKRIDRQNGKYIEGVGLGLSIVKQLLKLMSGDIEVVSIYGQGSDFKVYIPQTIAPNSAKIQSKTTPDTFIAPTVRLLIIDDNKENLLLFKALLERTAMQIDTAHNADSCLKLIDENRYDILVMDYMMPDMNGIELLEKIKDSGKLQMPVIAITADAESGTKDRLLNAGFNDYLTKPIAWELLEQSLVKFIPKEKYRLINLDTSEIQDVRLKEISKLSTRLEEYGIDCDTAFYYAGNNYELFSKTVLIYLLHIDEEIQTAKSQLENEDIESLHFIIHTLKSRAKNIGAHLLYQTAAELEPLCRIKKYDELNARMPYLFYLWEESRKGLQLVDSMIKEDTIV